MTPLLAAALVALVNRCSDCAGMWTLDGPTPDALAHEFAPGTEPWGLLLVAKKLHAGSTLGLDFAFLSHALGQHTHAAAALVDAANHGDAAVAAWLERYAPTTQEVAA